MVVLYGRERVIGLDVSIKGRKVEGRKEVVVSVQEIARFGIEVDEKYMVAKYIRYVV